MFRSANKIIMLVLAVFMFTAPMATSASAGESMTTKEINALFPGSFKAVVNGFVAIKLTAYRSGRLHGTMGNQKDRGRWSVRKGVLCIVLNKWMDGKARCSRVKRSGNWYRVASVKFKRS